MRRREFITFLGGAAVACPLAPQAQQSTMPVVGILYGGTTDGMAPQVTAFRRTLSETGYIEGRNVTFDIECRARRRGDRIMRRREFMSLRDGSAAWPLAARAQQKRPRRVAAFLPIGEDDSGVQAV